MCLNIISSLFLSNMEATILCLECFLTFSPIWYMLKNTMKNVILFSSYFVDMLSFAQNVRNFFTPHSQLRFPEWHILHCDPKGHCSLKCNSQYVGIGSGNGLIGTSHCPINGNQVLWNHTAPPSFNDLNIQVINDCTKRVRVIQLTCYIWLQNEFSWTSFSYVSFLAHIWNIHMQNMPSREEALCSNTKWP